MKIKQIVETTTAGSIASVAQPLGKAQKRTGNLFKGKKTKSKFYEGEIKRIATDMDELSDSEFKKKYGKSKEEMRRELKEEEIIEADLILMPGQIKRKDKSFIPHDKDRRDHEVEMARSDLYAAAKDAMRIYKMLKNRTEDQGLMGWQQSYITLANDYLNSVADSLEHDAKVAEMTGGVIAGGMSNFEEDVAEASFGGMPYDRLQGFQDPRGHSPSRGDTSTLSKQKFKQDELSKELDKKSKDSKPEDQIDEKKDACYSKVKSRYKVWPSAYASGALSKCRKVGASNWGNKSKK